MLGLNDRDVHESGELADQGGALVHEGAGILMDVLEVGDLLIQGGDLSGERVDLTHGLHHVQIEIAALSFQRVSGGVESGGEVARRRQHSLAQRGIGGIGGKLLQAVEELADGISDTGIAATEHHLNLLQGSQRRIELSLLLRFLVQAEFENRVAQALEFFQNHSGAETQPAQNHRIAGNQHRPLPGKSGSVGIGHVVGGGFQRLLVGEQRAQSDGKRTV